MDEKKGGVFYRAPGKAYPMVERAKGVYIYDTDGKKYLDGASGCVVTNIGYGVTEVADAMRETAANISYVHSSTFTSQPQEELANCLAESAPGELNHTYFVSGGTEANETAMSMAIQYQLQRGHKNKYKIIGRTLSYHGSSFGTLSAASNIARRRMFSPLLLPFPLVPAPHCYRCHYGMSYPQCGLQCANALEQVILAEGPENVAAFLSEAIIGTSAGASVPPAGYFPRVREICDRYDVLFIADEVLCGYGRSGRFLALEHWGVEPDLFALGKGLGGGYAPLAAVVAHERVHQVFKENWGKFVHGYTYQGNPVCCSAGLAVYRYLRRENLFEQVSEKGQYLKEGLERLAERHVCIGDVRGKGLLLGLELVKDAAGKESFAKEVQAAEKVKNACLQKGLLLYTGVGGTADIVSRDYLLIAPPYVISHSEMDELLQILDTALTETAL